MNNTARFWLAVVGAMILAALATPQLAEKLPPGLSQTIAAIIAAALHKIDASDKKDDAPAPSPEPAPEKSEGDDAA